MRAPKRKVLLGVAGAVAIVLAGGWTVLHGHSGIQYRTVTADRGSVAYTISATGSPDAVVTVQVGSQVSGNILELDADFNSHVKKGQLVARIDPQVFQARLTQASAGLEVAKSAVVNGGAVVQRCSGRSG